MSFCQCPDCGKFHDPELTDGGYCLIQCADCRREVPVLGQILQDEDVQISGEPDLPGGKIQDTGDLRRGDGLGKTVAAKERVSSKTAKKEKFHQVTGI